MQKDSYLVASTLVEGAANLVVAKRQSNAPAISYAAILFGRG
jgi:hypothetical protein